MKRLAVYYWLTKPGIIYGNLITCAAGFLLAADGQINVSLMLATLAGTALIIASASVVNNFLDRNIDTKMMRTKKRSLATGEISVQAAFTYAAFLGLAGLACLWVFVNALTAAIGLAGFLAYTIFYSLVKRQSTYGTLVGTISGATPPVAGYTAVTGKLDPAALLLFLLLVCWQMPHFYSIAVYRLKEYKAAGIPILPAVKGIARTKKEMVLYILGFMIVGACLTFFNYTGNLFLAVILIVGMLWLYKVQASAGLTIESWGRGLFIFSLKALVLVSINLSLNAWLG